MEQKRKSRYRIVLIVGILLGFMFILWWGISNQLIRNTQSGTNSSNNESSADENKLTTIVIYRYSYWEPDEAHIKIVQDQINNYIRSFMNVQIEIREIRSADYSTKLNMAIASSDDVDLMWTASWSELEGTDELVKNNAVYDLTDVIQNYAALYEAMPEEVWKSSTYNNRNYFIPIYKEVAVGYDLMCKTELANSMGWDLSGIEKLSDLTPFLKQAKESGITYPYTCQNTAYFSRYYVDFYDFIESYAGISKSGDTRTIINLLETEEYKEFCTLMYNWAQADYINQTEFDKKTDLKVCYFDDYAFALWTKVPSNQATCSERYGSDMTLMSVTSKWLCSDGALGSCYAINANSKKVDACLTFLECLYTDQKLADYWTWGIEGVNYTKNAEGKIIRNLENETYRHDVWETNTIKAPSLLVEEPDNKVALYDQFNNEAIPSPAMGFRFDSTTVEAEYTAVRNLVLEFGYLLETGAIDPETGIPEYLDALNTAGLQTVLSEMQSQYDIWMSEKLLMK